MKIWGKLLAAVAAAAVVLTFGTPSFGAAFDPDRLPRPLGHVSMQIAEPGTVINHSSLAANLPEIADQNVPFAVCDAVDDEICDTTQSDHNIYGTALLPFCETPESENCVESLELSVAGTVTQANFLREAEGGKKWAAIPKYDFYKAGSPLLFNATGAPHLGGAESYAVSARTSINFEHRTKRFFASTLDVSVIPYSVISGSEYRIESIGSGDNNACVFVETGICGIREDFPADVKVTVKLRIPNYLGGWFMGRMKDPVVEVAPFSRSNTRMVVTAEPASVARFAIPRSLESITDADRQIFTSSWGSAKGTARGTGADDRNGFNAVRVYREEAGDKAAGVNTLWNIKTIRSGGGSGCLADTSQVLGIVSTNAMVYLGSSPTYEDGFLNYEVAGMHYLPDGKTEVLGTYDLVMRSETARCLYGFSRAPVSATVTVTGGSDQNVATTEVFEKDGWLKLAAYGFTFSEKSIRVKVTQPQTRSLTKFAGKSTSLSSKQRAEVRSLVDKSDGLKNLNCTATYLKPSDKTAALKRAQASCAYAKSIRKDLAVTARALRTKATSFAGKVVLSSK